MGPVLVAILLGASLCADCFAVSLCSSVTVPPEVARAKAGKVAAVFAVVQTGFLLAGWIAAATFTDFLVNRFSGFSTVARWAGFLILLWVGGMMLLEALRGQSDSFSLDGLTSVLLGGVATSIDALAVGVSAGLEGSTWADTWPLALSVFVFTALSVVAGMLSGSAAGARFGRPVRIAGGIVLLALAVHIVLG